MIRKKKQLRRKRLVKRTMKMTMKKKEMNMNQSMRSFGKPLERTLN
jgi:hypothetical protein